MSLSDYLRSQSHCLAHHWIGHLVIPRMMRCHTPPRLSFAVLGGMKALYQTSGALSTYTFTKVPMSPALGHPHRQPGRVPIRTMNRIGRGPRKDPLKTPPTAQCRERGGLAKRRGFLPRPPLATGSIAF
jgi:hypothetical protein